jgi:hypothetical protein
MERAMSNPVEIDRETLPQKRDLLGNFCFTLHFAVMIYIVAGWLVPWRPALVFYLLFIPAITLQWLVNKDSCILNNVEGFMRTGRWRNKDINPEEGAWLLTLANNVTGLEITSFQINVLTYSVLALVWLLALARLFWRV